MTQFCTMLVGADRTWAGGTLKLSDPVTTPPEAQPANDVVFVTA